jgi:hypothetical protein
MKKVFIPTFDNIFRVVSMKKPMKSERWAFFSRRIFLVSWYYQHQRVFTRPKIARKEGGIDIFKLLIKISCEQYLLRTSECIVFLAIASWWRRLKNGLFWLRGSKMSLIYDVIMMLSPSNQGDEHHQYQFSSLRFLCMNVLEKECRFFFIATASIRIFHIFALILNHG